MADLQRADQSISESFTRVMNATTSRWGMLTDPSIVGLCTAPPAVACLAAVRLSAAPPVVTALAALAAVPVALAVVFTIVLRRSRSQVVAWLASVPFPVENMNAVLNGLGDVLEITFRAAAPPTSELNLAVDQVSPECFVTKGAEGDAKPALGEPATMEVRIGVVDAPRNPSVTNNRRYERVRALVRDVLVPLAEKYPIVEVRVK